MAGKFVCPCCGYATLNESGVYEVCRVCYWEDDGQDDAHAEECWGGPNGSLSLADARKNFTEFKTCDERFRHRVRAPLARELPQSVVPPAITTHTSTVDGSVRPESDADVETLIDESGLV